MKDSIVVKLPYPYRFLGVTLFGKKEIGFTFTNYSIFLFRENTGVKDAKEYDTWIARNGDAKLAEEMMFAAAMAYTNNNYKRPNFTKTKLIQAISLSDESVKKRIIEAWNKSQEHGLVAPKKKTVIQRKR